MKRGEEELMYIGLDVHKRVCNGTLTDEEGNIIKRGRFSNDPDDLKTFLGNIHKAQITMEALLLAAYLRRTHRRWPHRQAGTPQRVKAIAEAKVKTDKVDSETLTHLLSAGLLPESYVPPKDIQELRDTVRRRSFLVRDRVKLMNRIHRAHETGHRHRDAAVHQTRKSPADMPRRRRGHTAVASHGGNGRAEWGDQAP